MFDCNSLWAKEVKKTIKKIKKMFQKENLDSKIFSYIWKVCFRNETKVQKWNGLQ